MGITVTDIFLLLYGLTFLHTFFILGTSETRIYQGVTGTSNTTTKFIPLCLYGEPRRDGNGLPFCKCQKGYNGPSCDKPMCKNGILVLSETSGNWFCRCKFGYTGLNCLHNPCNHGTPVFNVSLIRRKIK